MFTAAEDVPSLASLRAASNADYIVPRTNSRSGDRAFSVAAPRAWNRLKTDLKTASCSTEVFKRRLKTNKQRQLPRTLSFSESSGLRSSRVVNALLDLI